MKSDRGAVVRWFGAQEALTWALQAYYAACRSVEPPAGRASLEAEGSAWASKGEFLHAFHSALTMRLNLAAFLHPEAFTCDSASEQLGWPDKADAAGKLAFFECLELAGLSLPEDQGHNPIAGRLHNGA